MSEEQKNENIEEQENNIQNDENQNEEVVEEVKEPTIEDKYNELNNKYVRLHAEFDNYRKRTNKEKIDLISNASAGVLKDMLAVMDDFERGIENNAKVDDADSIKEGMHLIYNKFKGILETKGLKAMKAAGEKFDSEIHEAVAKFPAPKKKQIGTVIDDVEKGYYLNDKVIRFAKVVVGE